MADMAAMAATARVESGLRRDEDALIAGDIAVRTGAGTEARHGTER